MEIGAYLGRHHSVAPAPNGGLPATCKHRLQGMWVLQFAAAGRGVTDTNIGLYCLASTILSHRSVLTPGAPFAMPFSSPSPASRALRQIGVRHCASAGNGSAGDRDAKGQQGERQFAVLRPCVKSVPTHLAAAHSWCDPAPILCAPHDMLKDPTQCAILSRAAVYFPTRFALRNAPIASTSTCSKHQRKDAGRDVPHPSIFKDLRPCFIRNA